MDDYQKKQIADKLFAAQSALIAVSKSSGFDGLAAGLALYLSLKKYGKNAMIIAVEPTVNDANNLYGVDKIGKSEGAEDLVVTINNAINTVDKVTYNLEGDELKVKVHSLANSKGVNINDVLLSKIATYPDTMIAVGFKSLAEMKNEITHEQINTPKWIISINTIKPNEKFAQVEIFDDQAATISELTAKLMTELSMPFNEDISFNLYSGIKITTQMFSPKITSPSTLEAAKLLIKLGAGRANLAERDNAVVSKVNLGTGNIRQSIHNNQQQTPIKTHAGEEPHNPLYSEEQQTTPLEEVELKEGSKESWLKPPKIYRGSKSFDRES